ncbi:phosphopantothenoylcysteine decarboxylase domain-containing protein, partial [Candidatus Synechococcus spongiarum]|uniref:phosphopantothenoylcysteine decarboxylase domain-containing protein n=1 Tax=Candidatus Synechococcus spongiarum TaxID=431041 RepID=UPI000550DEC2
PGVTNAVKRPKGALPNPLPLQDTPDLAAALAARMRRDQWMLGFAAEHGLDRGRAREKLQRKGCDWIVLNPVGIAGRGFGNQPNGGVLLWGDGREHGLASQDKAAMAGAVWSALAGTLHEFRRSAPRPGKT